LGGALGNLCDRFFRDDHGAVVDFVALHFWPTFNVADACIVVGCVLLAISLLRAPRLP
jgi:signal peptidase II